MVIRGGFKQGAYGPGGALYLPEGAAPVATLAGDCIQRADFREGCELRFLDGGEAEFQVVDGSEGAGGAFANDFGGDFGAQAFYEVQAEAEGEGTITVLL
jgi:hypothetical protein